MSTSTRWPQELYGYTLNRALEDFFRRAGARAEGEEEVVQSTWTPAVDVKETDSALSLFVELPGITKQDIDISLENRILTVSGERRFDDEEKESYRRVERAYGKFTRTFRVAADIDGNKVAASFQDGVLKLELPKSEAAKPRQIEIA
ncbi:MAG TPA: Hsp20/alpha crystallin family protein [Thermoanaerobaculia bacterium]|jgi:HSP20 family protein